MTPPRETDRPSVTIRTATPADTADIQRFVVALAEDEEYPGAVTSTETGLQAALFGDRPIAHALVVEASGRPAGFALYYFAYSTITGRPTLHLEDLYVEPGRRGGGIGLRVLKRLAAIAVERDCARFEWWVLRTNVDAIRFYSRLGARDLDEIDVMRIDGTALKELAADNTKG